nr:hypothetical protein [Brucella intermedia]
MWSSFMVKTILQGGPVQWGWIRHIPDELLKHVSPLSWEHINLTGIYSWDAEQQMPDGFRPLRVPARNLRAA